MKSAVIELAGKLGGYQIARVLTRNHPKILMYHRFSAEKKGHEVTAATFERQLQLMKRYFQPMTLATLAQSIQQTGNAPKNAVVITVDDGYRDFSPPHGYDDDCGCYDHFCDPHSVFCCRLCYCPCHSFDCSRSSCVRCWGSQMVPRNLSPEPEALAIHHRLLASTSSSS